MSTPYGYSDPLGYIETRIILSQGNDATLTFTITDPNNSNAPVDITGSTVTFTRKSTRYVPDTDASAIQYNATLTDPTNGVCTVAIPETDNAVSGVTWYRLDVYLNSKKRTSQYGPLEIAAV